jgi:cytochrome c2
MIGDGAINRIGPHLNGLVGRGIGAVEGYDFSDIFLEAAAQGEVWTETALDGFIANPDGYLPGTSMVFPRYPRGGGSRGPDRLYDTRRRGGRHG